MFKIRSLKHADLGDCAKIMVEVFNVAPYNEKWTAKSALRKFQHDTKGQLRLSLGVFLKNRLVAFAIIQLSPWYNGESWFISTLAVSQTEQRKSIGTKLLAELVKRAQKHKIQSICLNSNCKAPAFDFYKKNSFEATDWLNMVQKL